MSEFAGWSTFRSGGLSPVEQIRLAAREEAAQLRREAADAQAAADYAWVALQADDEAERLRVEVELPVDGEEGGGGAAV